MCTNANEITESKNKITMVYTQHNYNERLSVCSCKVSFDLGVICLLWFTELFINCGGMFVDFRNVLFSVYVECIVKISVFFVF